MGVLKLVTQRAQAALTKRAKYRRARPHSGETVSWNWALRGLGREAAFQLFEHTTPRFGATAILALGRLTHCNSLAVRYTQYAGWRLTLTWHNKLRLSLGRDS